MTYDILTPLFGRFWSLMEASRELGICPHQLLDILESLDKDADASFQAEWRIDTEFDCLIFACVEKEITDE